MGIYIDLLVSRSVTKNEWESVYEEALELVRQLPLAEYRRTSIHGVDTYCLVRTDERTDRLERDGHEVVKCGWRTSGDYETMHSGESYYLPRTLTGEDDPDPEAGDAILGAFPAYLDYEWEDKKYSGVYRLWGNKTQGEPYHMYLLAVAALIESRLGKKAFTYGDITKGQFRYAVELANRYLKDKIDLPDRCDAKRLADRISELQLTEFEKARAFEEFYLGNKDAEFGEYIRSRYSATALNEYWRDRFKDFSMDNIAGSRAVRDYLLWGFGLRELCGFADPGKDSEGSGCETFIRGIMDTKLHWKEKDCSDPLRIDQEKEGLYSIYTQLAQVFYAAAANKKVDRYIPIGIIRTELTEGLTGVKCDVNAVIDRYLEEEAAKAQKETPYNTSGKSILGEAGA
ncbi:MAG: hypothetical protein PUC98_08270, partial [Clostridiales bacterium]|nr:hypothetical protein [Clostridiales bacterium]